MFDAATVLSWYDVELAAGEVIVAHVPATPVLRCKIKFVSLVEVSIQVRLMRVLEKAVAASVVGAVGSAAGTSRASARSIAILGLTMLFLVSVTLTPLD